MTPMLRRVLIVDPQPASARMVAELMQSACRPDVWMAPTAAKALSLAAKVDPDLIFCELAAEKLDGLAFTRSVRRSDLACRQAPVILTARDAPAPAILAARDAGAHEFLRRPFTMKDLTRRLEALGPRDWVEAVDYVGPDRRRFNSGDYTGPLKRQADQAGTSESMRIAQALKILRSALSALESDPKQATRAMLAQAADLQIAATAISDNRLASATTDLHRYLSETAGAGTPLNRGETERRAAPLLAYMPREWNDRAAA
ncbi:response regulator [Phenylobacterium hankyongense]|uniref:Response regulator n=1 Tax=Phenylobacterium hankyongense TaxID=1813876 RepID=A0A328AZ48_9CAUL|nr:response regulator [Phenylobacterium hankyongense]RAK59929.1 response regulator [Phenylobacterium hankyongense]